LGVEVTLEPGRVGQFDVVADGETIASRGGNWLTRRFGAGYPDPEKVLAACRLVGHKRPSG
jgi:hypothetical protein